MKQTLKKLSVLVVMLTLSFTTGAFAEDYLVFERKVTHLRRCCTNLQSSRTKVRSGCSFACALHLGNFSSKHQTRGFRSGTI